MNKRIAVKRADGIYQIKMVPLEFVEMKLEEIQMINGPLLKFEKETEKGTLFYAEEKKDKPRH